MLPVIPPNCFTPKSERVVQCVEFQGELIVATETRVYRLVDDKLVLIPFVTEAKERP